MKIPQHIKPLWQRFLDSDVSPEDATSQFVESYQIGLHPEQADEGLRLILSGAKTATSALLWEFEERGMPIPAVGSFSVVEDGRRNGVCVVQTTWTEVIPFYDIDADFSRDYAETDGTVDGWYEVFESYYGQVCASMGRELSKTTPLVCERFAVVYR